MFPHLASRPAYEQTLAEVVRKPSVVLLVCGKGAVEAGLDIAHRRIPWSVAAMDPKRLRSLDEMETVGLLAIDAARRLAASSDCRQCAERGRALFFPRASGR